MSIKILEFRHVTFGYGKKTLLKNISFVVKLGEVMSLLGPSGSGKTTILRLALGLEQPWQGEIFLNGQLVSSPDFIMPPETRGLGLVFQDIALFPHLNVFDNIGFGLRLKKHLSRQEKNEKTWHLLQQIGMVDKADRMPSQLSGGEQQRVALARALAPDSRLILMDEAFSDLDEMLRNEVRDWTLHFLEDRDISALLVTHSSEEAMLMSDVMAVLFDQELRQTGTPQELFRYPKDSYVAGIFGEINRFKGIVKNGKLTTVFGQIACSHIKNGKTAELVVRATGIGLQPYKAGFEKLDNNAVDLLLNRDLPKLSDSLIVSNIMGEVMEVRFLGQEWLVHWQVMNNPQHYRQHIHSRVPANQIFKIGDLVIPILNPESLFIFAL